MRRRNTKNVRLLCAGLAMALCSGVAANAQDWGSDEDDWASEPRRDSADDARSGPRNDSIPGWSLRAGLGFTLDPGTLLLNFELPYAFDRWVSAGPMIQVGLDDHDTIVAPTANVTVTIPDLPGDALDRLHPFALVGVGFAVIEDDNRQNDNSSAGFLIDFGFGVEYQLSDHFYLGSQMMFNFLPEETLDEDFFYSWQIGALRLAF